MYQNREFYFNEPTKRDRNIKLAAQAEKRFNKIIVGEPTTFLDVMESLILHISRKHLLLSTRYKAIVYFLVVFVLSFVAPMFKLPRSYFAQKQNFLNLWFVKWGWAWTLFVLLPFMYMTISVYTAGRPTLMVKQLARLGVGHAIWYFCVNSFVGIEKRSRSCSVAEHNHSESSCLAAGGRWQSFDISGHCFLLIYCCLIIAEEAKAFQGWSRLRPIFERRQQNAPELQLFSAEEASSCANSYAAYDFWVRVWFVLMSTLSFLWEFMLIVTTLYFHTIAHKLLGATVAIICWFSTYHVLYPVQNSLGVPGETRIRLHPGPSANINS